MLMYRYVFGRREDRGGRQGGGRRRWPRSRAGGCLLWVLLLIVVLIILSVMFGGFQKGTKAQGLGARPVIVGLDVAAGQRPSG
jgi:hypothetical protein